MSLPAIKILLIEDTPADAHIIQEVLASDQEATFEVTHVDRLAAGLRALATTAIDLVLLDLHLPDSRELESLVKLKAHAPRVPVVVLTASDEKQMAAELLRNGAQDYLVKGYVQVYRNLLSRSIRYAIERKRVEEQLRQASEQNDRLLASLPSILIGIGTGGQVTHWNAVAEATFGIPAQQVLGKPFLACPIRWEAQRIQAHLSDVRHHERSTRLDDVAFTKADGQAGVLGISVVPIKEHGQVQAGFLLFGADITERKQAEAERLRLQEELSQAQKMETIGRFAGGIAHDFNNFLQVILGFTWLIRSRHRDDRELLSDVQEIVHAAESASGMVRQLLAFSRRQPLQPKLLDINQTIENMVRLLRQFVGEKIRVELAFAPVPLMVKLDPTGLEQVVMNLCSNARDSMAQGGTLTVSTAHTALDAAFVEQHSWARAGEYVRLTIKDTGTGMDPDVALHIFEPFFTTKQLGKGTGLGLAVVYGVVRQHDGLINVQTARGAGTAFEVYLPFQEMQAAEAAAKPARQPGRPETILLIEDHERQRALDEEILTESGYRLAASCTNAQAPEQLQRCGSDLDAVIVELPDRGGPHADVLRQLRASHPTLKILVIGAAADEHLAQVRTLGNGIQVLRKPYVPAFLLDQLRQLLDQPAEGSAVAFSGAHPLNTTKKSVLVVDDEPSIRAMCERILRDGYEVAVVPTGQAALDALVARAYDLLLTDIKMPEMDGFQLIEAAIKVRPELRILAMSGFLEEELEQRLRRSARQCDILRKPFTGSVLQETVSRCL